MLTGDLVSSRGRRGSTADCAGHLTPQWTSADDNQLIVRFVGLVQRSHATSTRHSKWGCQLWMGWPIHFCNKKFPPWKPESECVATQDILKPFALWCVFHITDFFVLFLFISFSFVSNSVLVPVVAVPFSHEKLSLLEEISGHFFHLPFFLLFMRGKKTTEGKKNKKDKRSWGKNIRTLSAHFSKKLRLLWLRPFFFNVVNLLTIILQ